MCLYSVRWILRKPNVKGLEDDDNISPPQEPLGLDFSSPWRQNYLKNRHMIKSTLHILHPSMQVLLRMSHESLGNLILINCNSYRLVVVFNCIESLLSPAKLSHTRTVVWECCKGDYQSQWERGKFDPPPPKNPSADSHQNLCRWLRRKYLPTSKISFKSNGEPAMLHTGNFSDPEVLCSWWFFPSLVKEVMACAKEHANDHVWH